MLSIIVVTVDDSKAGLGNRMCGIAGFISLTSRRSRSAKVDIATAMHQTLRHRGPDGSGVWCDEQAGVWLAHRRLAIIDLSEAGAQPMQTAAGAAITYNGEIYNANDLRHELSEAGYRFRGHSDTEVLLYACEMAGVEGALRRLTGMFAFAYWDPRVAKLTLACDRLGKKPLYWARTADGMIFASELGALLAHPDCPRRIDNDAVADFLRLSYVPAPFSILSGVNKLEPGHLLTFNLRSEKVETQAYWSVEQAIRTGRADPFVGTPEEATREAEKLLENAVASRMVSDVPLGSFLSGGIDSSLITALMQKRTSRPIRTFAVGFREAEFDESRHAEAVARHLGTEHQTFILEGADALAVVPNLSEIYDEPFADASQLPTFLVAKAAREHVTVALSGDGGDEVFAGYNRYLAANGLANLSKVPPPVRALAARGLNSLGPRHWDRLFGGCIRSAGAKMQKLAEALPLSESEQYERLISYWPKHDEIAADGRGHGMSRADPAVLQLLDDPVARMRYQDMVGYLPGDILTKVDRATMAVSLEARAPLLDHRLVEFSWRLPTSILLHQGRSKWILREILSRHVPSVLFKRPKAGFTPPVGEWLRGPLRDWAEALLQDVEETGIVRTEPVRAVWRRHLDGTVNAERRLWPILMLLDWRRRFAHSVSV